MRARDHRDPGPAGHVAARVLRGPARGVPGPAAARRCGRRAGAAHGRHGVRRRLRAGPPVPRARGRPLRRHRRVRRAAALRRALPDAPASPCRSPLVAGMVLPGCECASVPVARRLVGQGVPDAVACAFLLAAPAVNPVVLVATAVAFPGEPRMVVARFLGSLATACVMGWLWQRAGRAEWITARARTAAPADPGRSRWAVLAETARHDLVSAGGFLCSGGWPRPPSRCSSRRRGWTRWPAGCCSRSPSWPCSRWCWRCAARPTPSSPRRCRRSRCCRGWCSWSSGPRSTSSSSPCRPGRSAAAFAVRFAPATFVVAVGCATVAGVRSSSAAVRWRRRTPSTCCSSLLGGAPCCGSPPTTRYLRYVRPGHRWLLVAAGLVIVGLAAVALVRDRRDGRVDRPAPRPRPHRRRAPRPLVAARAGAGDRAGRPARARGRRGDPGRLPQRRPGRRRPVRAAPAGAGAGAERRRVRAARHRPQRHARRAGGVAHRFRGAPGRVHAISPG